MKRKLSGILAMLFVIGSLVATGGCERTSLRANSQEKVGAAKKADKKVAKGIPAKAHIEEYYSHKVLGEFEGRIERSGADELTILNFLDTGDDFKIHIDPESGEISPLSGILQWDEGTKSWEIGSDPMHVGTRGKYLEELWLYSGRRRSYYSFDEEKKMYRVRLCVMGYFDNGEEDYYSIIYYFKDNP